MNIKDAINIRNQIKYNIMEHNMAELEELKDIEGNIIQVGDFVLTSPQEIDYAFYDLDHEDYYLGSINIYKNPYPKIILHITGINRDRNLPHKLSSINAKSINRDYWLRLYNHIPEFKSLPLQANSLSEFYSAYKTYLQEKMQQGDLDAMVLLAEYLYNERLFLLAKKYLEEASDQGHAYASYLLAEKNRLILSPPADQFWSDNRAENCKFYLERSAEQGNPTALYVLGYYYQYGKESYKKNPQKAVEFYQLSAEQDYPYAMCNLADKYEQGKGIEQDYAKALDYYQRAAKFRIPEAMYSIGKLYLEGKGIEKDIEQAKIWLEQASFYRYRPAKKLLLKLMD